MSEHKTHTKVERSKSKEKMKLRHKVGAVLGVIAAAATIGLASTGEYLKPDRGYNPTRAEIIQVRKQIEKRDPGDFNDFYLKHYKDEKPWPDVDTERVKQARLDYAHRAAKECGLTLEDLSDERVSILQAQTFEQINDALKTVGAKYGVDLSMEMESNPDAPGIPDYAYESLATKDITKVKAVLDNMLLNWELLPKEFFQALDNKGVSVRGKALNFKKGGEFNPITNKVGLYFDVDRMTDSKFNDTVYNPGLILRHELGHGLDEQMRGMLGMPVDWQYQASGNGYDFTDRGGLGKHEAKAVGLEAVLAGYNEYVFSDFMPDESLEHRGAMLVARANHYVPGLGKYVQKMTVTSQMDLAFNELRGLPEPEPARHP